MDLIPQEYSTELIFDMSLDKESAYSDRVEDLGFETHNTLFNLGSLFYFTMIVLILMIVNILASINCRCKHKQRKYIKDKIPI